MSTGRLKIEIVEQKPYEEPLVDLGSRLIDAQERERSRIARELHDDFNQRLALLSIELEQIGRDSQNPAGTNQLFHKVQKQVQELSADIHALAYRLHPAILDHLGLEEALTNLCVELAASANLKIEFCQNGFPTNLSKDVALCLFRITQEALRNCIKHSGSQSSRVLLSKTKATVRLSVMDDGCGFDPDNISESGLGLLSMRERLNGVGGKMRIDSELHRGTRIEVTVPLGRNLASEPSSRVYQVLKNNNAN